jgi:hypothetical protein
MMKSASTPTVIAKLESLSKSLPKAIGLDYKALNTWCQRAIPCDAPTAGSPNPT